MTTDAFLELSDNQDLSSATTGTNLSTNTIDLGVAGRDIGNDAQDLTVLINIDTAIAGTSSTIDFRLVTSANANLSSDTTIASSGAIAEATLVAGYQVRLKIPQYATMLRYIGIDYFVGTANLSAGAVTASIEHNPQNWKAYANAV